MLRILVALIGLTPTLAMGQENCRYFASDGLSVEVTTNAAGDGVIDIFGSDQSITRCKLSPSADKTIMLFTCDDFTGDLILVPSKPGETFPDIIVMPPNILYWRCAVPT